MLRNAIKQFCSDLKRSQSSKEVRNRSCSPGTDCGQHISLEAPGKHNIRTSGLSRRITGVVVVMFCYSTYVEIGKKENGKSHNPGSTCIPEVWVEPGTSQRACTTTLVKIRPGCRIELISTKQN